jgi:hypothetical protein
MTETFFITRWLRALLMLAWSGVLAAWLWPLPGWPTFLGLLLAGTFAGAVVGGFVILAVLRALRLLFVSPIEWLFQHRNGTQFGSARWAGFLEVRHLFIPRDTMSHFIPATQCHIPTDKWP